MFDAKKFITDTIYGERLLISKQADTTELEDNIRVARVLLCCFADMKIRINEHLLVFGHKNPEYTIDERLADRKGIESEHGVKSAFRKAKDIEKTEDITLGYVLVWGAERSSLNIAAKAICSRPLTTI
ncbi:MAG: hypothetical protein J6W26_00505 [Bacteroidales bacterium]|nr:hypothetical protein [Bacteroidales bacterium]